MRGTTRSAERLPELEAAGVEGVVADPDRLATLVPALSGVTVVCWLMGTAPDAPDVHGDRLRTLTEHLVDTPVRGLVYEAGGTVDPALLSQGAQIVREASRTWRIRWRWWTRPRRAGGMGGGDEGGGGAAAGRLAAQPMCSLPR